MKFKHEYYTLKNGLRVYLMPSDTVFSATIEATVKTGSAQESDKFSGITHFIEHSALAATKSWPSRSALSEIREFNGAKQNGSTGRESLDYWINIPYNKVDFGLQYIYEVLYEATLAEKQIEQERGIIIDEISKILDNPGYQSDKFVSDNLTTHKSGYLRDIAGTAKTVNNFSVKDIRSEYKRLHSPNKVMISVVGNFNVAKVKKQIEKLFGSIKKVDDQDEYPLDGVKQKIIKTKKSSKTDLIFTTIDFPSLGANELSEIEKKHADLLFTILSGPMSSRLMKRLRQEENLLYHISAGQNSLETFGYSEIYYEVLPKNFAKAFKATIEELEKYLTKGTNEKELNHYKEFYANRYLTTYDNVYSYSRLFQKQLFWGYKPLDLERSIKVIKETTVKDINKMIPRFLDMKKISAFGFGKVDGETEKVMKESLEKFIK